MVIEVIAFGVLIAKYISRDESYERPDRKGEWKIWVRGAQVRVNTPSIDGVDAASLSRLLTEHFSRSCALPCL